MTGPTIAQIDRYSNSKGQGFASSLVLHLLPGLVITLAFFLIAAFAARRGWPPALALLLTWLIAGVPLELGFLLYQGQKRNGRLSFDGIVLFRDRLPFRQYFWLVSILLVWTGVISTLLIPFADALHRAFFGGWPEWLVTSSFVENLSAYPKSVLWAVVALSFVLNIVTPTVEELYFRGYLLPRLSGWNQWAPLINVLLFSLYHFWLPWENPTRVLALLPVVYAVWWKRNIYLSIAVHCLLNSIGSIGLLVLVLGQK